MDPAHKAKLSESQAVHLYGSGGEKITIRLKKMNDSINWCQSRHSFCLFHIYLSTEVANVTSKCNGVTRLVMLSEQQLYIKSYNVSYGPRAITIRSDNDFHVPRAINIESDNLSS